MSHENIERFIQGGWDLDVVKHYEGGFHARVWLGIARDSHNFKGATLDDALSGLDRYLAPLHTRSGSQGPIGSTVRIFRGL